MTIDFIEELHDPVKLLNCEEARQVVHNQFFSVEAMDDKELREAIIHDILMVTMFEIQTSKTLHFGFTSFLKFVERRHHNRIIKNMCNMEIDGLITVVKNNNGSEIRIKNNKVILQSAMNYCGVYYTDFDMPENTVVFNRVKVNDNIEKFGGIDNFVKSMSMYVIANYHGCGKLEH